MSLKTLFRLWLPLAISFELMMAEGPAVQSAIGSLPDPKLNLAAWGLALSLSLIVESPVIMLLATAIALVKDESSYRALHKFMMSLNIGCTVLTFLIAFTPLFNFIAGTLMGLPEPIVHAAKPAMQMMLLWTAAIGWRRFYQGVLIKYGQTHFVTWGTACRLIAAIATAILLVRQGRLTGVEVGACALMAAVIVEAIATTFFARNLLQDRIIGHAGAVRAPLSQRNIYKFHAPLAATTLLTLLAQPITSSALARLDSSVNTLAAWPVVYMVLLVMRGWGLAVQEITVAQAKNGASYLTLRRFAWIVGGATSLVTLLLSMSPLLGLYYGSVLHLPQEVLPFAYLGVGIGVFLPLLTALGAWVRGILVAKGETKEIYKGMGVNLAANAGLLLLGVLFHLPGMWVAVCSLCVASLVEILYLAPRATLEPDIAL